jgi:hypothetical protein
MNAKVRENYTTNNKHLEVMLFEKMENKYFTQCNAVKAIEVDRSSHIDQQVGFWTGAIAQ